jgi:transcriptional regulator with XRE-family HTH domain
MAKKTSPLLPSSTLRLQQFGERLRLARLRRKLTALQVAERAGMTVVTLRNLERGNAGVTIGAWLAVMQVLGIDSDFDLLAKEDLLGRGLQDAALLHEAPRLARRQARAGVRKPVDKPAPKPYPAAAPEAQSEGAMWLADGDFVSSTDLASLITPPAQDKPRKKR